MEFKYNYIEVLRWAHRALAENEISPMARYLFLYLLNCANSAGWKNINLSISKITNDTGISRSGIFRFRKELIEKKFLLADKGFSLNSSLFPTEKAKNNYAGSPAINRGDEYRLANLKHYSSVK